MDEEEIKSDAIATAALVKYFNHELAERLVERILKVKSTEAWRRLTESVLGMLPKAAEQSLWSAVNQYATSKGREIIASKEFAERAERFLAANLEDWMREAVERAVRETAHSHVGAVVKRQDVSQAIRELPTRFKVELEKATAEVAREAALKELEAERASRKQKA